MKRLKPLGYVPQLAVGSVSPTWTNMSDIFKKKKKKSHLKLFHFAIPENNTTA